VGIHWVKDGRARGQLKAEGKLIILKLCRSEEDPGELTPAVPSMSGD
jgi:hypothetical protein